MKKILIIWIILISFGQVFAKIKSIEKNHKDITQNDKKGIEIKYHTNNYDLLYYGTTKWAVRFNFPEYFSGSDNQGNQPIFRPRILKIYADNEQIVEINIQGGNSTAPNDTVFVTYENTQLMSGWNEIQLPVNMDLRNTFWIILSSDVNINSTASYGSGEHSYYWVQTTETEGYFANMQDYNFNSELLFTLEGVFTPTVHNIELSYFRYINNDFNPNLYSPEIKIKNNGLNTISNIELNININSSIPDFNPYIKQLLFPEDLVAGDSLIIDTPDSLNIFLSQEFGQYNFSATLSSSDTLEYSYDNSLEYFYNNFPETQDKFLLENFLISSDQVNSELWNFQSSFETPNFLTINYFPLAYDLPYSNTSSQVRFNFYSGLGYPTTIVNGYKHLTYFNNNYQNNFQTYSDSLNFQSTFISFQENSGSYYDDGRMNFRAIINNTDTYLFSNFSSSLKLYVALIQDSFDEVVPDNYFIGFISPQTGENINLNYQESGDVSLDWNKSDFISLNEEDWINCKLVYWIQGDNKIYFVNTINISDFEHFVNNDDENVSPLSVKSGPNPFNPYMSKYKIIFNNKISENSNISIFNIKGQLVKKINVDKKKKDIYWDGKDLHNYNCPSGIYLMKIINNNQSINKKIILMK